MIESLAQVVYERGGSVLRMLHAYLALAPEATGVSAEAPDAAGGLPAWQLRRSRRLLDVSDGTTALDASDSTAGADPFYAAINTYLQAHLYGTGTTDELWSIVTESAGRPMPTALQRWTHQQGCAGAECLA